VEFYLHSSVNPQDPEVKAAIESSRFRLSGDQLKSEHPKKKLLTAKSTHEEETTEENNPVVWNHFFRGLGMSELPCELRSYSSSIWLKGRFTL
ncbi:hypothetical protein AC249_AIPGENE23984, partial [Exaiptasia diaphana]